MYTSHENKWYKDCKSRMHFEVIEKFPREKLKVIRKDGDWRPKFGKIVVAEEEESKTRPERAKPQSEGEGSKKKMETD